jgi:hypothetical protein
MVDKKPPHNLTLAFHWSNILIGLCGLLLLVSDCLWSQIHVGMETIVGLKFQSKVIEYINLHGNVSFILSLVMHKHQF